MRLETLFLSATERGNPDTSLDAVHAGEGREVAWSVGNLATPLIHGATYFPELARRIAELGPGDRLYFTDWQGNPDELLTDGVSVSEALCAAARRGVDVRGLLWRSHDDAMGYSEREAHELGRDLAEAGGECLLDMRVAPKGSHHQKFVVLRHADDPARDVAYVGGIDLCHSRHDDAQHHGDPQPEPMAAVYGPTPPWHDIHLRLQGPAVYDVETVFRERWEDPNPLTLSPWRALVSRVRRDDHSPTPLGPQAPPPPSPADVDPTRGHAVQLLRTYPSRLPAYPFAREGERSVARALWKVAPQAQRLLFVQDQYLWGPGVADLFAHCLAVNPRLRLVVVMPHYADQDGALKEPPQMVGRHLGLSAIRRAGGSRVAAYGLENASGTPIYVHAKSIIVDDFWASIGSANLNRRSWTHDSELTAAVVDLAAHAAPAQSQGTAGAAAGGGSAGRSSYAVELRTVLVREHLGSRADGLDLTDPDVVFDAMAASAAALQGWYDGGRVGPRPPGQLRPIAAPEVSWWQRRWARRMYETVYDPDGRPKRLSELGAY